MSLEFVEDLKREWMAMIDAIGDPLVIIDSDYTILRQNVAYVRASRKGGHKDVREFRGEKCFKIFAGRASPCPHCQVKNLATDGEVKEWNTHELIPERTHEIRAHRLLIDSAESEKRGKVVVHYRDITEIQNLQDRLAQADKLTALGKLAGGVAHEINSPLAGILAFTQMVIKEMTTDDVHYSDLKEIEDAARKCKAIVENLLGFARQGRSSDVGEFNVYDVLSSSIRLAAPLLRKFSIEQVLEIPEDPAVISANPGQVSQVFLNLITNAIQSMQEAGGTLTVEGRMEDGFVIVTIHDTGHGIPSENLSRIFDPFFTTKAIGEGTGLGLSISYSIIKQFGGEIRVRSSLGIGSSFSVVIPVVVEREPLKVV
jgi:two-component system NtrC family sensor kinase